MQPMEEKENTWGGGGLPVFDTVVEGSIYMLHNPELAKREEVNVEYSKKKFRGTKK